MSTSTEKPAGVPTVALSNGVEMPVLGFGVFQTPPEETARCVREALEVGYRLIDTAQAYFNEEGVGAGIAQAIADGTVTREEVFVTTKIAPGNLSEERAAASLEESRRLLGLDTIDLVLLHQPIADYPGAWRALEADYDAGRSRAIGVSNFYPDRLADIAHLARVRPMVNQIETHPFRQGAVDHELMASLGIVHEAWAPFAEGKGGIFTHPVLTGIAEAHGATPGQVALAGLIAQDVVVIPKTVHRERMEENLAASDLVLTDAELEAFKAIEDPDFPRIFDHQDPAMIGWLVDERIRKTDLGGKPLY